MQIWFIPRAMYWEMHMNIWSVSLLRKRERKQENSIHHMDRHRSYVGSRWPDRKIKKDCRYMIRVWVPVHWCLAVEIIPQSQTLSNITDRNWCHPLTTLLVWICSCMAYCRRISICEMETPWTQTGQPMKKPSLMQLRWIHRILQIGRRQKASNRMNDLWITVESWHRNQRQIMHFCYMVSIIWNRQELWQSCCHMVCCSVEQRRGA